MSLPAPDSRRFGRHALVVAGLLFAPFLIDAWHAGPATDDFCYAAQYDKSGFMGSLQHYYTNVNGRFFAAFLILSMNTLFPIESAYFAVPLLYFTLLILGFCALFWAIAPRPRDWRLGVALSLLSALILIVNTEAIAEVFYWLSAGTTYVSSAAATLVALACMVALAREDLEGPWRLFIAAAGALAAILAVGSFEAAGPVIIAAGCFWIAAVRQLRLPGIVGIAAIAAGAAFGLWLNLGSSGLASRAAVLSVDTGRSLNELIYIVFSAAFWTSEHLAIWGSRASVWILAFALFWAFRGRFAAEGMGDPRRHRQALGIVLVGLAALPYLAAFPMFYAYFLPHPTRTHFFVDVFCLLFWLAVLPVAFAALRKAVPIENARLDGRKLSFGLVAACFLTIAGTENFFQASLDTIRGAIFAEQAAAQLREIREQPNRAHEVVLAKNVTVRAPTLWVSNITPDPRRWENLCYAEYLGAYGVRVEAMDDKHTKRRKAWYDVMPEGWVDPDPQAIGRPRPVWPSE